MALAPGTRLGPYEIAAQIGEGGMGEVYRATDTKLKRQVAIKVLPDTLASDAERLARFQREAEVLASLNHPNIAHIYGLERLRPHRAEDKEIRGEVSASVRADSPEPLRGARAPSNRDGGGVPGAKGESGAPAPVEEDDALTALIMELVEGQDLSQRIARGAIPIDEALPIAKQIAEALDAAHEQGIIHRDLKPANIKVRPDCTVKVLDFGVAKAMEKGGPEGPRYNSPLTQSPTITTPAMTQAGMILGTAAYMAPEQARGRTVDKRADIWAFGCVLYEMLTGERLFKGEDVTETLASVVKDQPDLDAVPARVRRLLAKCLEKDPKKRLRDIGDAWELLEPDAPIVVAAQGTRGRWPFWAIGGLAALATVGFATIAFVHFRETAPVARPLRLSVPLPQERATSLAISPDGRRLVIAVAQNRDRELYLRSLASGDLEALTGTRGARQPFWSADSRFIGFFADDALKVIPAAGGPVQVLCGDTGRGWGGTWNRLGVILFASSAGPLRRVDAAGGDCTAVGEGNPAGPAFLPDGDHFFYTGADGVYLAALEEPVGLKVLGDYSGVVYSPAETTRAVGHLLFLREGTLMAQPFDEGELRAVDDPFPVAAPASRTNEAPLVAASVSADGMLAYLTGGFDVPSQLTWFDRTGKALGTLGPAGQTDTVALSPDGARVLYDRRLAGEGWSAWLWDLARGSTERLTALDSTFDVGIWSPDSGRIWFRLGSQDGGWYQKDLRSGARTLVLPTDARVRRPSDWTRDGRFVIYTEEDPKSPGDVWSAPVESGTVNIGAAVKVVGTDAVESQGQLSPDGLWLAYASDETGRLSNVYLRPFPTGDTVWKVSLAEGVEPRWRADGKELFFMAHEPPDRGHLMAVPVERDARGGLRVGAPHELFETRIRFTNTTNNVFSYSADRDGQRFLVNVLTSEGLPAVNVITDWRQAVAERIGATAR